MRVALAVATLLATAMTAGCAPEAPVPVPAGEPLPARPGEPDGFVAALSAAALERTTHPVRYDGSYRTIPYPGGDVPADTGVCTDVVVRAYRTLGIDLQVDVHREMAADFDAFPRSWGLEAPDPNIDHRRVPNLEVLFQRRGHALPVTGNADDYLPGDLVTWDVIGRPHIGIIVERRSRDGGRFLVVHNIGRGPRLEDMLFDHPITGHYRYYGGWIRQPATPEPDLLQ